jgi:hypothetical protein
MDKKYIIELKIWHGEKRHKEGLSQLAGYLEKQNQNNGYLIIFNFNQSKEWKQERIVVEKKDILAVWV